MNRISTYAVVGLALIATMYASDTFAGTDAPWTIRAGSFLIQMRNAMRCKMGQTSVLT